MSKGVMWRSLEVRGTEKGTGLREMKMKKRLLDERKRAHS